MTDTQKTTGKTLRGEVVSVKMDKTAVVQVNQRKKHPKYGKFINQSKRFIAHDEESVCKVGDKVTIRESRPISKTKNFVVVA